MSLFKKKNKTVNKQVEDSMTIVTDYQNRDPYFSYTTCSYNIDTDFFDEKVMLPLLKGYVDAMPNGSFDEGNRDYLDNIIISLAATADNKNCERYLSHSELLNNFVVYRKTTIDDLEKIIETEEEELEDISKDIKELDSIGKKEYEVKGEYIDEQ